jgi:hypothetical protein
LLKVVANYQKGFILSPIMKITQGAANLLRHVQRYGNLYLATDHPEADKRARQANELERKGLVFPRCDRSGYLVATAAGAGLAVR